MYACCGFRDHSIRSGEGMGVGGATNNDLTVDDTRMCEKRCDTRM